MWKAVHWWKWLTKTIKVNATRTKIKVQKIYIFTRSYLTISHSNIIEHPMLGDFNANNEKEWLIGMDSMPIRFPTYDWLKWILGVTFRFKAALTALRSHWPRWFGREQIENNRSFKTDILVYGNHYGRCCTGKICFSLIVKLTELLTLNSCRLILDSFQFHCAECD